MFIISELNLQEQINKELMTYSKEITEKINEVTKSSIKELVDITKDTAPISDRNYPQGKRKKHFKSNITSTNIQLSNGSIVGKWYVKGSDYRLTHLLENGHATRNGGRVEGTRFLSKATNIVVKEFEQKVEEVVKNG